MKFLNTYITRGPNDGLLSMAAKHLGVLFCMFLAVYVPTVIVWTVLRIFFLAFGYQRMAHIPDHLVYFPYWVCRWLDHAPFHHFGFYTLGSALSGGYVLLLIFVALPCFLLSLVYRLYVFFIDLFWPRSWRQTKAARVAVKVGKTYGPLT